MLNCNCGANCTCNKGISGLSNCPCQANNLSGLRSEPISAYSRDRRTVDAVAQKGQWLMSPQEGISGLSNCQSPTLMSGLQAYHQPYVSNTPPQYISRPVADCKQNGSAGCPTSYLPAPLSGLGGLSVDFVGTLSGAAIGLALNHIFGWGNWQMATSIGAISGGLLLPSMYN